MLDYSDESAHYSDVKGATATFRFTGTAVDVYSRTNGDVGIIRAVLYKVEKEVDRNQRIYKKIYR